VDGKDEIAWGYDRGDLRGRGMSVDVDAFVSDLVMLDETSALALDRRLQLHAQALTAHQHHPACARCQRRR
jgi:hypothetical protein